MSRSQSMRSSSLRRTAVAVVVPHMPVPTHRGAVDERAGSHIPPSKNAGEAVYHGPGQGAFPMRHRRIGRAALAFALAGLGMGLAQAAELETFKARRHVIVLPPERHVIEIVKKAYSDRFIINGAGFTPKTPGCGGNWRAGGRVGAPSEQLSR